MARSPIKISSGRPHRGFTLLYTLLVVSLVLAISSSILGIVTKEVALSGYARDSQIAYYAAESAAECVLFHALNGGSFDGSETLECNGETVSPNPEKSPPLNYFTIYFPAPSTVCAHVTVQDVGSITQIDSRGYNVCSPSIRRVERGVRVIF